MNTQFYMEDQDMLEELVEDSRHTGRCVQIEPILHRDGLFKWGKKCWFEVRGQAFTYEPEMFDLELSLLNIQCLDTTQMKALKMIVDTKLASKEQKAMYQAISYNFDSLSKRLESYKFNKLIGL